MRLNFADVAVRKPGVGVAAVIAGIGAIPCRVLRVTGLQNATASGEVGAGVKEVAVAQSVGSKIDLVYLGETYGIIQPLIAQLLHDRQRFSLISWLARQAMPDDADGKRVAG